MEESWYYTCRFGARVLGMCLHTAAIIWYLSNARHKANAFRVQYLRAHVLDPAEVPAAVDDNSDIEN